MKFQIIPVVITAALTSVATVYMSGKFQEQRLSNSKEFQLPVSYTGFTASDEVTEKKPVDFEFAAATSIKAVVHIKTQTMARTIVDQSFNNDFFGNIFGPRQYYIPPQQGSGSGVIVSADGYIVTNYHVIANAKQVTVTYNDRLTASAKIVAKDLSTDIAVLKVDDINLPYMEFGNSDDVKVGQWVLAIGYPLTLDATVTAGIVSAKSRAIGINKAKSSSAIESFIQTDAAVNPGNSGGALVNTKGQLIGINSAITSPTGSYAGYSYAIPSNIVKKVVRDLIKYGSLQRAFIGIEYPEAGFLTPEKVRQIGLDKNDGVYIAGVRANGGASKAGIKAGDVIVEINGISVHSETQLQEQVARYQPGDNVSISYVRNGETRHTTVELTNINGSTGVVDNSTATIQLGVSMKSLSATEKNNYGVTNGIKITNVDNGIISKQTDIKAGFIIVGVNNIAVNSPEDIQRAISQGPQTIAQIAGVYPQGGGRVYYYTVKLDSTDGMQ